MKPKSIKLVTYKPFGTPAVFLSGKFLAQYGFDTGAAYYVDYKYGQITIIKVADEPAVQQAPQEAENRPIYGRQYRLTGTKEDKCIMNGHSWAESEVPKIN